MLSLSIPSRRSIDLGGWGTRIDAMESFEVPKIGTGRELTSRTRPTFGLIALTCRALNAFPNSTFGCKSLTKPNQNSVRMLVIYSSNVIAP